MISLAFGPGNFGEFNLGPPREVFGERKCANASVYGRDSDRPGIGAVENDIPDQRCLLLLSIPIRPNYITGHFEKLLFGCIKEAL
jgi:hypothetical protein